MFGTFRPQRTRAPRNADDLISSGKECPCDCCPNPIRVTNDEDVSFHKSSAGYPVSLLRGGMRKCNQIIHLKDAPQLAGGSFTCQNCLKTRNLFVAFCMELKLRIKHNLLLWPPESFCVKIMATGSFRRVSRIADALTHALCGGLRWTLGISFFE